MQIINNKLYQILTPTGQYLAMGLDGKMVVYNDKVDTLINSVSRSKQYQIPQVVRLIDLKGVKVVNGKLEEIIIN